MMKAEEIPVVDCRTEEGITIGLIDSIISISRVLNKRLQNKDQSEQINEALKDLRADKDLADITLNPNFYVVGAFRSRQAQKINDLEYEIGIYYVEADNKEQALDILKTDDTELGYRPPVIGRIVSQYRNHDFFKANK